MSATYPIHHITLTVTDVKASTTWFQALFGPADIVEREFETFTRTRMTWPELDDLRIAVMSHHAMDASATFDHLQPGLDELGYVHGPVEDVQYAVAVTARTPDNIPVEFFFAK